MTRFEAQARTFETYDEEPQDTGICTGSATVTTLYGTQEHAIRRRVKRAFHDAGHGKEPNDALANARHVLGLDEFA